MAEGRFEVIEHTPSMLAASADANDIVAAVEEIKNFTRVPGGACKLKSLILLNKDDQAVDLVLYLFNENVSIGTEDANPSWEDADADALLARIALPNASAVDLTNSLITFLTDLDFGDLILQSPAGSRSIWMAMTTAGTPTFTASGVTLKFGVEHGIRP